MRGQLGICYYRKFHHGLISGLMKFDSFRDIIGVLLIAHEVIGNPAWRRRAPVQKLRWDDDVIATPWE